MSKTTDLLNQIQPKPHEQWNARQPPTTTWCHRKTIQFQRERIEKLQNELDFEILHKTIAEEELRRVQDQLDSKAICFRAAMRELGEMDKKLQSEINRSALILQELERYQDLFFNLGDAVMGLSIDPDQTFKQPETPTKLVDTFMSDYTENHPGSFSSSILMSLCPDECGYEVEIKNKACKADYVKEACEACWDQPLEVEK